MYGTYALCHLGVCYETGKGVEKNDVEAFNLFSLAAQQDDLDGKCRLALCYKEGLGVGKDTEKAAQLFREVAETGDADAQSRLAACFFRWNRRGTRFPRSCEVVSLSGRSGGSRCAVQVLKKSTKRIVD